MKAKVKQMKEVTDKLEQGIRKDTAPGRNATQLQKLFHDHLRAIKDEIRQRKMLHQLTNTRAIRKE